MRLAFTDSSIIGGDVHFVGWKTFVRVLGDNTFPYIIRNTLVFVLSCIILQLSLGLVIAVVLDRAITQQLKGTVFIRGTVLVAWVIPGIVIGVIWKMILQDGSYGIAKYLLSLVGVEPIAFLSNANSAMGAVILSNTWRGTAFSMIMQFAALQKIPRELYESAEVDGAGFIQRFLHITLPQLREIIFINLVLITIYTVNLFDMILPLTGGGPGRATEVIALSLYSRAFSKFDLAGASALAVIMLITNVIMALIYYRIFSVEEE
ncbi:sugar ABC transporter permease [Treponema sp.]